MRRLLCRLGWHRYQWRGIDIRAEALTFRKVRWAHCWVCGRYREKDVGWA
jgi:hypothetical protein